MKKQTNTFYEVKDESGSIGKNSKYSFDTYAEAKAMITEFIADPRCHNENMTDDNVKYWKARTYTIQQKVVETTEIKVILPAEEETTTPVPVIRKKMVNNILN